MTIIITTKLGVSYADHMTDDTLEANRFSCENYQAFSSPHFLMKEPGKETNRIASAVKGTVVRFITSNNLL